MTVPPVAYASGNLGLANSNKEDLMTTPDLALDIAQFAALLVLSIANGVIAFSVFSIQKDRNTPKLVVNPELVEDDERDYMGLYVQNVGLVPALNVRIAVDVEEWIGGKAVDSKFHQEGYQAFVDRHVSLQPQEHRLYELPSMEGASLIVAAVVSCGNGPSDDACFLLGNDPEAFRRVATRKSRRRFIGKLKSKQSGGPRSARDVQAFMGLNSLKDYDELFGR